MYTKKRIRKMPTAECRELARAANEIERGLRALRRHVETVEDAYRSMGRAVPGRTKASPSYDWDGEEHQEAQT